MHRWHLRSRSAESNEAGCVEIPPRRRHRSHTMRRDFSHQALRAAKVKEAGWRAGTNLPLDWCQPAQLCDGSRTRHARGLPSRAHFHVQRRRTTAQTPNRQRIARRCLAVIDAVAPQETAGYEPTAGNAMAHCWRCPEQANQCGPGCGRPCPTRSASAAAGGSRSANKKPSPSRHGKCGPDASGRTDDGVSKIEQNVLLTICVQW